MEGFSCWYHCTTIKLEGVKPCQLFVSLGEQPSELLVRLVQLLLRDAGPAVLSDVRLVDLAREQAPVRPEAHATVGPLKRATAVRILVREVVLEPVVVREANRLHDAQHLLCQLISERRLRSGSGGLLLLGEKAEHDVLLETFGRLFLPDDSTLHDLSCGATSGWELSENRTGLHT